MKIKTPFGSFYFFQVYLLYISGPNAGFISASVRLLLLSISSTNVLLKAFTSIFFKDEGKVSFLGQVVLSLNAHSDITSTLGNLISVIQFQKFIVKALFQINLTSGRSIFFKRLLLNASSHIFLTFGKYISFKLLPKKAPSHIFITFFNLISSKALYPNAFSHISVTSGNSNFSILL